MARMIPVLLLSTLLFAETASADTKVRAYVRVGPPAPVAEVRPAPPGRHHVWITGYHRWNGSRYVWVPGRWVVPPRARAVWVPGRWERTRHGWHFVEGRWK